MASRHREKPKGRTPTKTTVTAKKGPWWPAIAACAFGLVALVLLVKLWSSDSGSSSLGHSHGKRAPDPHAAHSHAQGLTGPQESDDSGAETESASTSGVPAARDALAGGTITDRRVAWPTADQWLRVVTLRDSNTRVVVLGTTLLGIAAGVVGSFTLLRKRALMGDALSHATLPGIGLAFMIASAAGGSGKSLPVLLAGAAVTGALGLGAVLLIRNLTRLKEDTALGIVLSAFFGAGIAVLGVAQRTGQGHAAGLESFIYGKTASMVADDAMLIAGAAALVTAGCALLFKEFRLLCFDAGYAASQGWPTVWLDVAMMTLVVVVTVVGLQAVGLILIIALLIIPAAAARFWTERLSTMMWIAAAAGGVSGVVGAAASAILPNLPSGAMIVIVAGLVFLFSMTFGRARGVLVRLRRRSALNRRVRRQHLLRAMYEAAEAEPMTLDHEANLATRSVRFDTLLRARSWSTRQLRQEIKRADDDGLVDYAPESRAARLTPDGYALATRVVRNHRLWETYLITHADIAASHVDRDADAIEHVLGSDMVRTLEAVLADNERQLAARPALISPHALNGPEAQLERGSRRTRS